MAGRDVFRIGDLAARTGLSRDALRYYERLGLLSPIRRTSGGFRVYPLATLDRIRFIKQAQDHGLSLSEIKELLGFQDRKGLERCRQVHHLLTRKLADLDRQVTQLNEFRQTLRGYLHQCETTLDRREGEECPVVEELSKDEGQH
jgi:DNA-binding transcriptional MerR regulator